MKYKKILFLLFAMATCFNGFSQIKQSPEKNLVQPRQDTLKNLSVKSEPAIVDTLTNLSLKFKPYKKSVHASYYHDKFNGRRTASGTKFSNKNYTAAHRKFPFGTKLRITNEKNGKSVIVEVQDRGPFSRGREIDLTRKAFMEIADNQNSGSMTVTIEEEKR
jgi:rare lipoprotein A